MEIDDKISNEKLVDDINKGRKISALSSGKKIKNMNYLTSEEILLSVKHLESKKNIGRFYEEKKKRGKNE